MKWGVITTMGVIAAFVTPLASGHPSTSAARPTYERLEIFDFLVSKVCMVVKSAWFSISSVRVISSCANEVINRGRVFTGGARSRY